MNQAQPIATHGVRMNRMETALSKHVSSSRPKVSGTTASSIKFSIIQTVLFAFMVVAALKLSHHKHNVDNYERPRKPDLALLATGASLNTTFTSPTHDVPALGFWARILARGRSFDVERVKRDQPTIVFEDINLAGRCWYFTGSSGSIAVTFARSSLLEQVVLRRPAFHILPPEILAKTPHQMILWGVLDEISSTLHDVVSAKPHFRLELPRVYNGKLPPPQVLNLGNFTYRMDEEAQSVQTFNVIPEGRGLPFRTVILEVLDNYGGQTTCMHQVSIYGEDYDATSSE